MIRGSRLISIESARYKTALYPLSWSLILHTYLRQITRFNNIDIMLTQLFTIFSITLLAGRVAATPIPPPETLAEIENSANGVGNEGEYPVHPHELSLTLHSYRGCTCKSRMYQYYQNLTCLVPSQSQWPLSDHRATS
jgi:hypothetical protein